MDIFGEIKEILTELLDIEPEEIEPESYVIRDLGAESIDLLELAVELNASFKIEIADDEVFLKKLRLYLTEVQETGADTVAYLGEKFPFLTRDRIKEILSDLEAGPVLKVKDLIDYVACQSASELAGV